MNGERILEQADSCVKCALCLAHCPTYRLASDENESPRGRISLIQGMLTSALDETPRIYRHLDHCLGCGVCESGCPSEVPFTEIMDQVRAHRVQGLSGLHRWLRRQPLDLASHPARPAALARTAERLGLRDLARWTGLLRLPGLAQADRLLPSVPPAAGLAPHYPATPPRQGHVALFTGCVSRQAETAALQAAVRVLTRLGFEVSVPQEQCCCGAMYRHEGYPAEAKRALDHSAVLFGDSAFDAVVGLASACCHELSRHPDLGGKARELSRFLADAQWPSQARPLPSRTRVAIHLPCTQANLLRDPTAARDLLARIPELAPLDLPDNGTCCGAAGFFMLREPQMSQQLLAAKLAHLEALRPQLLVTTNTGCALHLAAGIREAGLDIPVRHPVQIIDAQMPPLP